MSESDERDERPSTEPPAPYTPEGRLAASEVEPMELVPELEPTCATAGTEPEQVLGPHADRAPEPLAAPESADLQRLLAYLRVSHATFSLGEDRYFGGMTEHLRRAGILGAGERVDRTSYADAVRRFQRARGLEDDGIPGQDFCWAVQKEWADARNLQIVRVDADRVSGSEGFDRFYVRSDVVDPFRALRAAVLAKGGAVTSAGAFRSLGAAVTPGRSVTSMHYSGLALDLATDSGMRDPQHDAYVVTQDGGKWRVWCRSAQAPPVVLDSIVWRSGATDVQHVTVNAFDFTELAERAGFARIGPRSTFPADYLSGEWWHFQLERALVPWLSQFGIELLSLSAVTSGGVTLEYDEAHLSAYEPWVERKRIFQRGENGWW